MSGIPRPTFFALPFLMAGGPGTFAGFFGLEPSPLHRVTFLYYLILALALLTNLVTIRLRRHPIGRAWEALREDEIAARALGLSVVAVKLTAFATGAMFGGLAGAFFATRQGFISPESFTFIESALILAIVVLGGMGSQLGVATAAIVMIGGFELFRDLEEFRMLVFGLAMVAIMVWRPRGFVATREPSVALRDRRGVAAVHVGEGRGRRDSRRPHPHRRGPHHALRRPRCRRCPLLRRATRRDHRHHRPEWRRQDDGVQLPPPASTDPAQTASPSVTPTVPRSRSNVSRSTASRRARVARSFQNIRLFGGMTVLENLMVAQHNRLLREGGRTPLALLGSDRSGPASGKRSRGRAPGSSAWG